MPSSALIEITKDNFEKEVLQSERLVLIDFYADWCGPCKAMAPAIEAFAAENLQIKVVKVNVDTAPDVADAFNIKSIPTLVTLKDGRALIGTVGNLPKRKIEEFVASALQYAAKTNIESQQTPKGPGRK